MDFDRFSGVNLSILNSRNRFGRRAGVVAFPIGLGRRIARVRVTVATEVRARVVLADVLGHDATTGRPLPRILLVVRFPTVRGIEQMGGRGLSTVSV
jgi:hypothetical protein